MLPQLTKEILDGEIKVIIKTTHGDMAFTLFEKYIPKSV